MEKEYNFRSITNYVKARHLISRALLKFNDNRLSAIDRTNLLMKISDVQKDALMFEEYFLDVFDIRVLLNNNEIPYRMIDEQVNLITC